MLVNMTPTPALTDYDKRFRPRCGDVKLADKEVQKIQLSSNSGTHNLNNKSRNNSCNVGLESH